MELMGVPDVDVAGPVPIILFQKMCALHDSGQLIEAKSLCLEILKKYPEHVETINRFGTIVGQLGDLKLAIQVFRQAIVLDPSRVVSTYNRGIAFYNLGNFDAALLHFNRVIELAPTFNSVHFSRGPGGRATSSTGGRGKLLHPDAVNQRRSVLS